MEISIFNIKDAFFERTLQTAEKIRKAVPECVVNVYDIADTAKMSEETKLLREAKEAGLLHTLFLCYVLCGIYFTGNYNLRFYYIK